MGTLLVPEASSPDNGPCPVWFQRFRCPQIYLAEGSRAAPAMKNSYFASGLTPEPNAPAQGGEAKLLEKTPGSAVDQWLTASCHCAPGRGP